MIGSAQEGSGILFPGDMDHFETIRLNKKDGLSVVSKMRRGLIRIAQRIAKDSKAHLVRWEMGGERWTLRRVKSLPVKEWKMVVESKEPILIEVLVEMPGGLRLVSNSFHFVYGNNQPILQPKSLDTPDSLLEGAIDKAKKRNAWKALKRYQKYLEISGKSPKLSDELKGFFNTSTGLLHRVYEMLDALLEAVGPGKLNQKNRRLVKQQLQVFEDNIKTIPGINPVLKRMRGLIKRTSRKGVELLVKKIHDRVQKDSRALMKKKSIKIA